MSRSNARGEGAISLNAQILVRKFQTRIEESMESFCYVHPFSLNDVTFLCKSFLPPIVNQTCRLKVR